MLKKQNDSLQADGIHTLMPLNQMTAAARKFKLDSVSQSDLAWVAVGAGAQD